MNIANDPEELGKLSFSFLSNFENWTWNPVFFAQRLVCFKNKVKQNESRKDTFFFTLTCFLKRIADVLPTDWCPGILCWMWFHTSAIITVFFFVYRNYLCLTVPFNAIGKDGNSSNFGTIFQLFCALLSLYWSSRIWNPVTHEKLKEYL